MAFRPTGWALLDSLLMMTFTSSLPSAEPTCSESTRGQA